MASSEFLTESERTTKKWWLVFLFVGLLFNATIFFGLLGPQIPDTPFVFRLFGFGIGMAFTYLYYALCYRRTTTLLLTFSLVAFWLSLLANAILLLKGSLSVDLFFGIPLVTGSINYIFTWKLRNLNKALKGYAKFPEESKEAAAWIQSAASPSELKNFFSEGLKKWPRLKWVLKRERRMKEKFSYTRAV